jgi:hypothetical protein
MALHFSDLPRPVIDLLHFVWYCDAICVLPRFRYLVSPQPEHCYLQ